MHSGGEYPVLETSEHLTVGRVTKIGCGKLQHTLRYLSFSMIMTMMMIIIIIIVISTSISVIILKNESMCTS